MNTTCTYVALRHNDAPAWALREVTSGAGSALDVDVGPTTSATQAQRGPGAEGADAGAAAALESQTEDESLAAQAHSAGGQPREPASVMLGAEEGYLEEEGTQASAYARVVTPQEARWPRSRKMKAQDGPRGRLRDV